MFQSLVKHLNSEKKEIVMFFFFLFVFALLTKNQVMSWNDGSRLAAIQSLAETHTFIIDQSQFIDTGDKYFYQSHFYSDKSPILNIFGALCYLFFYICGITFANNPALVYYLLTLLNVGVFTSLGLVFYYKILKEHFKLEESWSSLLVIVLGFGTLIFSYSSVYNNHNISGSLLIVAFYCLLKAKVNLQEKYFFISGLLFALAGSIDFAVFAFLPLAYLIYVVRLKFNKQLIFIASSSFVFLVFVALNYLNSGSILPASMVPRLWDYPGSYFMPEELSGVATPKSLISFVNYSSHMLFGNRGLFTFTPVIIFAVYGWYLALIDKSKKYWREALFIGLGSALYISAYLLKSVDFSGYTFGVRWYVSIFYLLCLLLAFIGPKLREEKYLRVFFVLFSFFSIIIAFLGNNNPFYLFSLGTIYFTSYWAVLKLVLVFMASSGLFVFYFRKSFSKKSV